ncbi:MAG TPA: type VI secretion system tube protein Hcp [Gemmatimonadaceae bacterium]|nr:type VI secretion system tube protein Hcp [Gemmatimonadaceae bacterium]
MAFDAYLKVEGIDGASTATGFAGAIDILSFSWGASNPVSFSSEGFGAGKVSLSSFNIMKQSDKSSPTLFQACCDGKHYASATLTLRKAGGTQVKFIEYKFSEVYVESVQWSGSQGGDDTPTESVSFAFAKVDVTYTPQKADGTPGAAVVGSWDLHKVAAK